MAGHRIWLVGFASLLVLVGGCAVTFVKGVSYLDTQEQKPVRAILSAVTQASQRLEQRVNAVLALGRFLASQDLQNAAQLSLWAEKTIQQHPYVVSLSLSKGLVVDWVYPRWGNEPLLGMDYRLQPDQWTGVAQALSRRATVLSGPFPLVQSYRQGVVGRTPVFRQDPVTHEDQLVGLASVAMDLQGLLAAANLARPDLPFRFALRRVSDQGPEEPFYGSRDVLQQPNVIQTLSFLGESRWQLIAVPNHVMPTASWVWAIWGSGCLLSVVLALAVFAYGGRWFLRHYFSIRGFLMLLLMLMLLPVVVLTSYLSYQNTLQLSSQYVTDLADELSERAYDQMRAFFEQPIQTLRWNVEQLQAGLLPYEQPTALLQSFLLQLRQVPNLTFIALGRPDGQFYCSTRPPMGLERGLRTAQTIRNQEAWRLEVYRADYANQQRTLMWAQEDFDVRTRPWYQAALTRQVMSWYPVAPYAFSRAIGDTESLSFGISAPAYDAQGQLVGVLAVDVALAQLSRIFAETIEPSEGLVWLMEQNGALLASSTQEPIVHSAPDSDLNPQVVAQHSANPFIRAAGEYLQKPHDTEGSTMLLLNDQRYRLEWRYYPIAQGPQLTLALLVPASHFEDSVLVGTLYNVGLWMLTVALLCVILGFWATGWIVRPLSALSRWAEALAQGQALSRLPQAPPIQEIMSLSLALDCMNRQLRHNTEQLEQRILQRTQELETLNQQLTHLSETDGLTGIANRRCLDEVLAKTWAQAQHTHQSLAILMLDVDWFKKYNDCYGHLAGDACLKSIAQVLQQHARRVGDLAARYGGEEFLLIVANSSPFMAQHLAEALREAIFRLSIPHECSSFGVVTVSIGVVVTASEETRTPNELLAEVDSALYRAKMNGRNQIALV